MCIFACSHVCMCTIWMLVPLEAEVGVRSLWRVTAGFESDVDAVTAEPPFRPLVVKVLMTLSCSPSPDVSWCTASLSILCLAPLIGWTRRRNRATQITDTHHSPVTPTDNICWKCRIILFMRWTRTFSARIVNYFHSWHTENTHCLSCSLLKLLNSLS